MTTAIRQRAVRTPQPDAAPPELVSEAPLDARDAADARDPQLAAARSSSLRPERLAATASQNPVFVALQAVDAGMRVFARIGSMDAGERNRLRASVTALLAEHGIHDADLVFEVREAGRPGAQENGD